MRRQNDWKNDSPGPGGDSEWKRQFFNSKDLSLMQLSRLGVGTRLTVGFGALLVLFAVVIGSALFVLHSLNTVIYSGLDIGTAQIGLLGR
ncbi:MAG TPA: hypothetical protein VG320_25270, partial [Paraburkholderia sp.]|uniref:hypothetical protein n=1 Tax=Paraburkholderia sp. TaxID=1926495 RepID=UPI002DE5C4D4|nr:hypothetical protein [Paraburkholderia sp.]